MTRRAATRPALVLCFAGLFAAASAAAVYNLETNAQNVPAGQSIGKVVPAGQTILQVA